ncbi:Fc.00g076190.m01.CDS01 [Cosmosporella sp. VM-42]
MRITPTTFGSIGNPYIDNHRLLKTRHQAQLLHSEESADGSSPSNDQANGNEDISSSSPGRGRFYSSRRWKPLTFRDVDDAVQASRRKLNGDSSGSSSASPGTVAELPIVPRRRKSLGDIFQRAVKSRLSRDKSCSSSEGNPVCTQQDPSPRLTKDGAYEESNPTQLCDPPRLEVLSELPHGNNLQRSSTFRTNLEQAAADINNKYGSAKSLPESRGIRRRPSWRKTLSANSRVVIPIPPRSYFRPREDAPISRKTPSVGGSPPGGDAVNASSRHHKTVNRIPAHQVEKILEQSISLRDPAENNDASENTTKLGESPDSRLMPLLLGFEVSEDNHDERTETSVDNLVHLASLNTFSEHTSLVEVISDFQNPENISRSRNPSVSSWVTIHISGEDLDILAKLEIGPQDVSSDSNSDHIVGEMEMCSSLEASWGGSPATPRVQAMLMPNTPDTLHLPPAALDDALGLEEERSHDEQVSEVEALVQVGSWAEACTPRRKPRSSSPAAPVMKPPEESKTSLISQDYGDQSLEDLLKVQSFVTSRRRLFESSLGSLSGDDDASADESGASLGGPENLRPGKFGPLNSQNLYDTNYVGY